MNKITKEFLKLILEATEENKEEPKSAPASAPASKSSASEYNKETSNKLSLGRPLSNSALADARFRSEGSADDAASLLKDLKIRQPSGSSWQEKLKNVVDSSRAGGMRPLVDGAEVIKNSKGKEGVLIRLKKVWKDDDNDGKLSYSFIRSLIVASNRAGYIKMTSTLIQNLRLELVNESDELIAYSSKKAKSWRK
jgi:hypothetical protein